MSQCSYGVNVESHLGRVDEQLGKRARGLVAWQRRGGYLAGKLNDHADGTVDDPRCIVACPGGPKPANLGRWVLHEGHR
jgi:hypothetical protein